MSGNQDSDQVRPAGDGGEGTDEEKTRQDTADHNGINVWPLHFSFEIVNVVLIWMEFSGKDRPFYMWMLTTRGLCGMAPRIEYILRNVKHECLVVPQRPSERSLKVYNRDGYTMVEILLPLVYLETTRCLIKLCSRRNVTQTVLEQRHSNVTGARRASSRRLPNFASNANLTSSWLFGFTRLDKYIS